jgi:hypothetical protein
MSLSAPPHRQACGQIWADLALLERRQVDAVSTTRQEASKVGLSEMQRKFPQIVAIQGKDIEDVELVSSLCFPL